MMEKIIYIGGVARSGTSWIGQIFNSCPKIRFRFQPLFSYEFRDKINEDSSPEEYQIFYDQLFNIESDFLNQVDKVKAGVYPEFRKHDESVLAFKENRFQSFIEPMLRKSPNLSFIGVVRNPNATLYSWTRNEKEFPVGSDIMKEWRFGNCKNRGNEDYFGYFKWKEIANLYLDLEIKYKNRVQLIHYDKFLFDTEKQVRRLFGDLQLPYTDQTKDFLLKSEQGTDSSSYSVFRGQVDKEEWRSKFPPYIIEQIKADLKNTRLERFLL